jgi:hypothetical protein
MIPIHRRSIRWRAAACVVAMVVGVAPALWWWGLSPLAALWIAVTVACAAAMLYAWWLARRALRPLDNVGRSNPRRMS